MDRGKNPPGKSSKSKPLGFSGDFIALGSKSGRSLDSSENKPKTSGPTTASVAIKQAQLSQPTASGSSDRKREVTSTAASLSTARKSKPGLSGSLTVLGKSGTKLVENTSSLLRPEPWEEVAIEIDPVDLLNAINDAESNDDEERIEAILCGAVKQLRAMCTSQRMKLDPVLSLALLYLSKWRPQYFNTELIVEALTVLLKRDVTPAAGPYKGKTLAAAAVLSCNLLLAAFQEERYWPESFIKVYIEDSIGDRIWVDREECQGFVENILTAFNTKLPPHNILHQDSCVTTGSAGVANSPNIMTSGTNLGLDEEGSTDLDIGQSGIMRATNTEQQQVQVLPRYQGLHGIAEGLVLDVVKEQLNRRQQPASDLITRNFLKFLSSTCGLCEVRQLASQRLELWLSNPKMSRPAADLLLSICINCNATSTSDGDVINNLLRLRPKTKPLLHTYQMCFKEMVEQQLDQLPMLLRLLIFNELTQSRGPNNMAILTILVQQWPDRSAHFLADVFMELLLNREDYLRALRALLREIVRALKHELPLTAFCAALLQATLQERRELMIKDFEFKDRLLTSLADLATLCIFLAVSPAVRESAALMARGDLRDIDLLRQYQAQAATMQREAVWWLHESAPTIFKPNRADYIHCLRKVLFMETAEQYYNKDGWPPESDRPVLLRLASEIPLIEDTVIHILLIGLSKEHPVSPQEAVELCEQLLRRCAAIHNQGFPMLDFEKREIFDLMLNLTAYHHPENTVLPAGYVPPKLAITSLYWKAWLMLLLLTAHNPSTFGSVAWNLYPTLRTLMEMCITNNFVTFPPVPSPCAGEQQELQLASMEKQVIVEFESHLAAASSKVAITETNSLLISQLTSLDPRGPARRPSPVVIEQLRTLNATLRLGHLLCRSRQPDFLLDILQRQGPAQSMPWLADLVESNEGAWSLLPVQCLCEFLLHEATDDCHSIPTIASAEGLEDGSSKLSKRKERRHKQQQLVQHLRLVLKDPNQTPDSCREVLDYLLRRLSSQQAIARQQAVKGLSLVLSPREEESSLVEPTDGVYDESQYSWLLQQLPSIPHFELVRPAIITALRSALQFETRQHSIAAYLRFFSTYTLEDPLQHLADLTLDLAQMIVERSSLIAALLPSLTNKEPEAARSLESLLLIFWHYVQKAREPNKETYTWSENQDQVVVQWHSGESATLHILVIHAMVILLTYGAPRIDRGSCFNSLLDVWFPANGELPQAFLVETSEEALLYPDWLKLRMIRSSVEPLVDAALRDLEPGQLILFIQSFGIPVFSMSKLLQALDRMVQANPFAFVEVDMDKAYMQQLLQVQKQRGAQGGLQFADIMELNEPECNIVAQKKRGVGLPPLLPISSDASTAAGTLQHEHVVTVLRQLFDVRTVIRFSSTDKLEAYRLLSRTLASETHTSVKPSTEIVATALDSLLKSTVPYQSDSAAFLAGMEKHPSFACGLLRLLITSASSVTTYPRLHTLVLGICRAIAASKSGDVRSSLRNIARGFIGANGRVAIESSSVPETNSLSLHSKRLEKQIHILASDTFRTRDPKSLLKKIVESLSHCKREDKFAGLLVDWLELLDPEIMTVLPDFQQLLLFGRTLKMSGSPTCRPYMLALAVHQASWTTLRKCIHQLLSSDITCYDPTVVIDFLTACIEVPKLWQGRDKHVPKHHQQDDLLCLSSHQLLRLAHYIMEEYAIGLSKSEKPVHLQQVLQVRSKLLLGCCGGSCTKETSLVRSVISQVVGKTSEEKKTAAQQLLSHLYVSAPHLATRLPQLLSIIEKTTATLTAVPCAMDSIALTLISSLAAPQPGKDGARKMADLKTALRKMAATHPLLLLRQLPSLAAALRGRAHLDFHVLRSRNHLNLFSCALGLIQQLYPYIFSVQHRQAFEDILTSFWTLFDFQRTAKELISLLQNFLQILLNYVTASPFAATHYLQHYIPLLQELQLSYPELLTIKELLSALSLPRHADNNSENQVHLISPRNSVRLGPILSRLRQSDTYEEVTQVLQDMENVCHRIAFSPLEDALDDIRPLISSPNTMIRKSAYSLLLGYLGENPHSASCLLPDYLDCLENDSAAVVSTALQRLPDFLLLCQEHGSELLQKAFRLAVECGLNTLSHLSEAIVLLQLQSGT